MPQRLPHRLRCEAADPFGERLGAALPRLSPAGRRVARFLNENRPLALALSAMELAERAGTSDATVVRSVQALGFRGLPELKRELAAALAAPPTNPAEAMRGTLAEAGEESWHAVDLAIETQREAVEALATSEARATLRAAVATLHPACRILVFGLGPSAALARYLATLLGRAGRSARALDASGIALADQMLDLGPGDALLVLAYGRAYREVVALFGEARRLALPVVLVTDSLDGSLARHADVVVPARRGRARRVALHGATLVALEAIALGLAAMDGERALASLDRLNDLRAAIAGGRHDAG
ncbi:MurR/RpiR family transcriptional regulator [Roseomonas eburnea]|uniref:MurR/RpiR family transcriptional regulator n=1 Tax=Neoroseomonas eburnea TaxID=1346889 RepID=A0A9X9X709_9PROT|nr:MurR/RpiR family transcriptional regulator [Neoroseomonas eburnea]MBR0679495.1 MurR/RpiR family transcriptional regulator [Neoroseomonas eburnea]